MSDVDALRAFTAALLEDEGAEVRDDGTFLWLTVPEGLQSGLDLPSRACLTFDAGRSGEFDAELVAPGSYLLEKLLALATRRGRWDVARLSVAAADWPREAVEARAAGEWPRDAEVSEVREEPIALFAFRTAMTSDEKREGFHLVAAPLDGSEAWEVDWPLHEEGLAPAGLPGYAPDLEPAYRAACAALEGRMDEDLGGFRKVSLGSLEEEVRRIFRYFDGTVAEVRKASPSGAEEVVRAIEAERDRRLAEAVERFEPHAAASLCSVRVVLGPVARVLLRSDRRSPFEVRVDALTGHVRGWPPALTEDGPAPLPARPPSGTPRRRTRGGPGNRRSPPRSRERSRSGASPRRGP